MRLTGRCAIENIALLLGRVRGAQAKKVARCMYAFGEHAARFLRLDIGPPSTGATRHVSKSAPTMAPLSYLMPEQAFECWEKTCLCGMVPLAFIYSLATPTGTTFK